MGCQIEHRLSGGCSVCGCACGADCVILVAGFPIRGYETLSRAVGTLRAKCECCISDCGAGCKVGTQCATPALCCEKEDREARRLETLKFYTL